MSYSDGLSLFWWAVYFGGLSLFCWAVFILMTSLTCLYSAELSTEIVDYFCDWLQIVCPHFAQYILQNIYFNIELPCQP